MGEFHIAEYALPGALVAFIVYWIYKAVYNLYFHELAHLPGPKINAITTIPAVFHRIWGDQIWYIHRLHNKYGPTIRLGPTEVCTISASAWKEVYGHRVNDHGNMPKDMVNFYQRFPLKNGAMSILSADDDTHSRQRRIFAHAFSDRALREQEPLLKKYTDLFVEKLHETQEADGRVDMVRFYNFTTFDFIADCVFGEPMKLLENMAYNPWVMDIFAGIKFGSIVNSLRAYPIISKFISRVLPSNLRKKREAHIKWCSDRVDKRLERGETDHPDFWTLVMRAEGTKRALSLEEMHVNSNLLMTAGTETSATLLSGLTYYLLKNPDKMQKLQDEIRGAFTSMDEMTTVTLPRLKYLHMCIEEGLRIYSPVSVGLPRLVPPEGGEIDGYSLPPNISIYFTHWPAYHSEFNFARPDDFVPERWASSPPNEFKSDKREAFNPFSAGPRNCIGKNLAYHEIRLIMAKFLFSFDVELRPESNGWTKQWIWTLFEKHPLWVTLTPVVREK